MDENLRFLCLCVCLLFQRGWSEVLIKYTGNVWLQNILQLFLYYSLRRQTNKTFDNLLRSIFQHLTIKIFTCYYHFLSL